MIRQVILSEQAQKDISKAPLHIAKKLLGWIQAVGKFGLLEIRKRPGYHDEPLSGNRFGQRSIRLNRSYRAIYVLKEGAQIKFISVEEVTKHDY